MTDIKLGINNCFAVKRWPEPEECKQKGIIRVDKMMQAIHDSGQKRLSCSWKLYIPLKKMKAEY